MVRPLSFCRYCSCDAEKAAADAHKAEQEAGKYLDKEALGEKLEELKKAAAKEAKQEARKEIVP